MKHCLKTKHIAIDPDKCKACYKCVENCPKKVLGKPNKMSMVKS